jgi:hypothetical protein
MSISTLMCSLTRENPPGFPKFQSSMTLLLASGRFLSGVLLFIPTRLIGDIDAFGYAMLRTVRPRPCGFIEPCLWRAPLDSCS